MAQQNKGGHEGDTPPPLVRMSFSHLLVSISISFSDEDKIVHYHRIARMGMLISLYV